MTLFQCDDIIVNKNNKKILRLTCTSSLVHIQRFMIKIPLARQKQRHSNIARYTRRFI